MSPAVAARGKIRRAARRGQEIPLGYALDAQGRQTTDPHAALDCGTVQPIGGPKGSALAMLMDVMGGVISGAAFGGDVRNHFEDYDKPQNVGHFIMAMKPDLFVSRDDYGRRMDTLVRRVHACPTAEGFDEVIMPGERERRLEARHRRTGVPFHAKEIALMQEAAARVGLPPLSASNTPLA
jgi:LDH2 family malate/lactate/ureidoglycolate dehydrogenase